MLTLKRHTPRPLELEEAWLLTPHTHVSEVHLIRVTQRLHISVKTKCNVLWSAMCCEVQCACWRASVHTQASPISFFCSRWLKIEFWYHRHGARSFTYFLVDCVRYWPVRIYNVCVLRQLHTAFVNTATVYPYVFKRASEYFLRCALLVWSVLLNFVLYATLRRFNTIHCHEEMKLKSQQGQAHSTESPSQCIRFTRTKVNVPLQVLFPAAYWETRAETMLGSVKNWQSGAFRVQWVILLQSGLCWPPA